MVGIKRWFIGGFFKRAKNSIASLDSAFKASSKLCNIFQDLDVVSIYKQLGVKELWKVTSNTLG